MARNKSRRNGKRNQSVSLRGSMRKLHQAVAKQLPLNRIPNDPPPVRTSRTINMVVQALMVSHQGTLTPDYVGDSIWGYSAMNTSKDIMVWKLDWQSLHKLATYNLAGNDKVTDLQVTINRVSVWGPSSQSFPASIAVHADIEDAHCTYTDTGTAMVRPKVGFSVPFHQWKDGNTQGNVIVVEMRFGSKAVPADSQFVGVLQVGLSLKRDLGFRA